MKNKNIKAGKRLTELLLDVGNEQTEVSEKGRVVTKLEQLSRTIWSLALGKAYKDSEGEPVVRPPDKDMIKLLYERFEGRVGTAAETKEKLSAADKVTEQAKKRIANLGDLPDDSGTGS